MPELPSVFSLMLHAAGLTAAEFALRLDGRGSIKLDALTVKRWASDPSFPPPASFLTTLASMVGRDPEVSQFAIDRELAKASADGTLTLQVPTGHQPFRPKFSSVDIEWIFLGCVCAQALQKDITPTLVGVD
jgi:hypothetical protein